MPTQVGKLYDADIGALALGLSSPICFISFGSETQNYNEGQYYSIFSNTASA